MKFMKFFLPAKILQLAGFYLLSFQYDCNRVAVLHRKKKGCTAFEEPPNSFSQISRPYDLSEQQRLLPLKYSLGCDKHKAAR